MEMSAVFIGDKDVGMANISGLFFPLGQYVEGNSNFQLDVNENKVTCVLMWTEGISEFFSGAPFRVSEGSDSQRLA